jgi:hypothetical protein
MAQGGIYKLSRVVFLDIKNYTRSRIYLEEDVKVRGCLKSRLANTTAFVKLFHLSFEVATIEA